MKTLFSLLSMLFIAALISLPASAAHAQDAELNPTDHPVVNRYRLSDHGGASGQVKVREVFVGEPIAESVRITVSVQCAKGFHKKSGSRNESLAAYDYGRSERISELSSFDPSTQVLTVYYRTAKISDDGRPLIDKDIARRFELTGACRAD